MQGVVWVWASGGLSWITGSGGGVGVPGGVSWLVAWLLDTGGLVDVNAGVGNWWGGDSDGRNGGKQSNVLEHLLQFIKLFIFR